MQVVATGADGGGTALPWHQDGGEHWALDRDPLFFVWIALTQVCITYTVTACGGLFQLAALQPQSPAKIP
jgi:hypothetical protein